MPLQKHHSNENEIVEKYIGLVKAIAKSFQPLPSELDDYIQCGYIGLLKAIRKYDKDKGKLTTIAVPSIKWEILNYIRKNNKKIREFTNIQFDPKASLINSIKIEEYLNSKDFDDIEYDILIFKSTGMTFREISVCMNKSLGWVHETYHKSIDKVRELYS